MKKKKIMLPIIALLLGITSAFAFKAGSARQDLYYWFPLDPSSGTPQSVTTLIHQSTDPSGCTTGVKYCEGGYNTYVDNGDGTYSASGTRIVTDKKN